MAGSVQISERLLQELVAASTDALAWIEADSPDHPRLDLAIQDVKFALAKSEEGE